jgi:hypothetical protein
VQANHFYFDYWLDPPPPPAAQNQTNNQASSNIFSQFGSWAGNVAKSTWSTVTGATQKAQAFLGTQWSRFQFWVGTLFRPLTYRGSQVVNLGINPQGQWVFAPPPGHIIAAGSGNFRMSDGSQIVGRIYDSHGALTGIIAAGSGNAIRVYPAIIAAGSGNIIAAGSGNIIAAGSGNIIAAGSGNIIAAGSGNFRPMNGAAFGQAFGGAPDRAVASAGRVPASGGVLTTFVENPGVTATSTLKLGSVVVANGSATATSKQSTPEWLYFTGRGESLIAALGKQNAARRRSHKRLGKLVLRLTNRFVMPHGKAQTVARPFTLVP